MLLVRGRSWRSSTSGSRSIVHVGSGGGKPLPQLAKTPPLSIVKLTGQTAHARWSLRRLLGRDVFTRKWQLGPVPLAGVASGSIWQHAHGQAGYAAAMCIVLTSANECNVRQTPAQHAASVDQHAAVLTPPATPRNTLPRCLCALKGMHILQTSSSHHTLPMFAVRMHTAAAHCFWLDFDAPRTYTSSPSPRPAPGAATVTSDCSFSAAALSASGSSSPVGRAFARSSSLLFSSKMRSSSACIYTYMPVPLASPAQMSHATCRRSAPQHDTPQQHTASRYAFSQRQHARAWCMTCMH